MLRPAALTGSGSGLAHSGVTYSGLALGEHTFTADTYDAYGNTSRAASVWQVAAPPDLSVDPHEVSFGAQMVGTTSAERTVTVTNSGDSPLTISGATLSGAAAADYTLTDDCVRTSPLAAGVSCTSTISFHPSETGDRPAVLSYTSDAPNGPHTAAGSGAGEVTLP